MPGYDAAQRVARECAGSSHRRRDRPLPGSRKAVRSNTTATASTIASRFRPDAHRRLTRARTEPAGRGRGAIEIPDRGRQFESTKSPDGRLKAFYKDRNVWISAADGSDARAVTTDGSAAGRVKYGTASWVYGEELSQRTAMWWSPDSRKLAYYRFDERDVRDYYVTLNQTQHPDHARHRGVPDRRHAEPERRSVRLRRRDSAVGARRRPRAASRSTTTSSATTSIACRGRPTAASCSSSARTGGRT